VVRARVFLKDGRLRPVLRVLVFFPVFFVILIPFLIVSGLAGSFGSHPGNAFLSFTIFELAVLGAMLTTTLLLRRFVDRRSIESLGFTFSRAWFKLLAIGVAVGVVMQSSVFLLELSLGYVRINSLSPLQGMLAFLALTLVAWLAAAGVEEIALRGYLFQNLWEEFGPVPAAIATALFFGALHLGNPNAHAQAALTVTGIALYGLLACWIVVLTRSLWLAIGVHCAWNICEGPVYGFAVSGLKTPSLIDQTGSGPDWLTGGAFGPESGAIMVVPLALGALLIYALHRLGVFSDLPDTREAYAKT
jgi:membrane protease YdiL (CAAX protease family)